LYFPLRSGVSPPPGRCQPFARSGHSWLCEIIKKSRRGPVSRILCWVCGAALGEASRASLALQFLCYRIPGLAPCLKPSHGPFEVPTCHPNIPLGSGQVLMAHEGLQLRPREPSGRSFRSKRVPKLLGRYARKTVSLRLAVEKRRSRSSAFNRDPCYFRRPRRPRSSSDQRVASSWPDGTETHPAREHGQASGQVCSAASRSYGNGNCRAFDNIDSSALNGDRFSGFQHVCHVSLCCILDVA